MRSIFPNGSIGVLALILSMIGYFMGVGGNNGCAFGTVVLTGGELDYASGSVGWGIWNRESPGNQEYVCDTYTSTEESLLVDGKWRASRAMAVFANVCGGACMIICICLSCVSIPKTFLKITSLLSFTAGFFQCLVFIWFSSDACSEYSCRFSRGAGFAVGAAITYMLNTFIIMRVPLYQGRDDDIRFTSATPVNQQANPPPGSTQVTTEVMADGTKKTTCTVVNADGSQTVTETIEHPARTEETAAVPFATAVPTDGSAGPAAKTY